MKTLKYITKWATVQGKGTYYTAYGFNQWNLQTITALLDADPTIHYEVKDGYINIYDLSDKTHIKEYINRKKIEEVQIKLEASKERLKLLTEVAEVTKRVVVLKGRK